MNRLLRLFDEIIFFDAVADCSFAYTQAVAELRHEGLVARRFTLYMLTNRFKEHEPQYNPHVTIDLPIATDNTGELIRFASRIVGQAFKTGYRYKKAGVLLTELVPADQNQIDIFDTSNRKRTDKLMTALDFINSRMGSRTLQFAAQGCTQPSNLKCEQRTAAYTTDWDGLLVVRAD